MPGLSLIAARPRQAGESRRSISVAVEDRPHRLLERSLELLNGIAQLLQPRQVHAFRIYRDGKISPRRLRKRVLVLALETP